VYRGGITSPIGAKENLGCRRKKGEKRQNCRDSTLTHPKATYTGQKMNPRKPTSHRSGPAMFCHSSKGGVFGRNPIKGEAGKRPNPSSIQSPVEKHSPREEKNEKNKYISKEKLKQWQPHRDCEERLRGGLNNWVAGRTDLTYLLERRGHPGEKDDLDVSLSWAVLATSKMGGEKSRKEK